MITKEPLIDHDPDCDRAKDVGADDHEYHKCSVCFGGYGATEKRRILLARQAYADLGPHSAASWADRLVADEIGITVKQLERVGR